MEIYCLLINDFINIWLFPTYLHFCNQSLTFYNSTLTYINSVIYEFKFALSNIIFGCIFMEIFGLELMFMIISIVFKWRVINRATFYKILFLHSNLEWGSKNFIFSTLLFRTKKGGRVV